MFTAWYYNLEQLKFVESVAVTGPGDKLSTVELSVGSIICNATLFFFFLFCTLS